MAKRIKNSLTREEIAIAKALLERGFSNQEIVNWINIGRALPINGGRMSDTVKSDGIIPKASEEEADNFLYKKRNYDYKTGLNPVDDARLIYAREAMCAAVGIFNNPSILFKAEGFCVLANIAWTYLVHEYCLRKNISIQQDNGQTSTLEFLINQPDFPLAQGIKDNLASLKRFRDAIEHKLPDIRIETRYDMLFQACCLNFDKMLREWFGERLSLQKELSIALQFAKHDIHGIAELQKHSVPRELQALDAQVYGNLSEEQLKDLEYRFKLVYVKQAVPKGSADMAVEFVAPDSAEGKQIHNILLKKSYADKDYPFRPMAVCEAVRKATGRKYTGNQHTEAWKRHKVRPAGKIVPKKGQVQSKYCHYRRTHKDYLYNQAWVDLLIAEEKAKAVKP
ncbi:DUF3644 domain-containing protein [Candidatus Tokpelaia sp.]|uniref:DUF3644 domain-containing protein n=1 Tax=Candidatus Tokpelaia sp. TaxID=2233777 RepID=UPI00123AF134|nr:DUF3644 domain-containing protein [Candidatus Tokpelaia sp.]KAA6404720.1 hypothetical protein DPQ22_07235 [Candidatus Tokpelaia sp.]